MEGNGGFNFLGDFWGFLIFGGIGSLLEEELPLIGDQQRKGFEDIVASQQALRSNLKSDLKFMAQTPNYICYHVCLGYFDLFWPKWWKEERKTTTYLYWTCRLRRRQKLARVYRNLKCRPGHWHGKATSPCTSTGTTTPAHWPSSACRAPGPSPKSWPGWEISMFNQTQLI